MKKLEKAKGGDDGGLWDVCRVYWNLKITLLKVDFRKKTQQQWLEDIFKE